MDRILIVVCIALIGIVIITLGIVLFTDSPTDYPSIEHIYEDGAGTLSDGRLFCIKGEFCDD